MGEISPEQVVLLPHSHWDREWYEPFASFRLTLAAMMDVGLGLLDEPGQTAVLAEGVMEYEVTDASIAVTLLRAVGIIAKPTVPARPIWAGPSIAAPDGQCQGTYRMSFGINPSARAENLVHDHECFALPLLEIETDGGGAHDTGQLLDVAGARISAIRRRGDALEVRVWSDSVTHRTASVWGMAVELGPAEIRTITVEGWGSGSPALGHASPV